MDKDKRLQLYGRVKTATGKTHVELKAIQEFTELVKELSNIVDKLLKDAEVNKCDKNKLLDEIADVIITFEQAFEVDDARAIIDSRIALKLERLERNYLRDNLFSKFWVKLKGCFNA